MVAIAVFLLCVLPVIAGCVVAAGSRQPAESDDRSYDADRAPSPERADPYVR
jgi:hypothetical protein